MSRSQQSYQKREKEKQRMQHRQNKAEKMQERKANAQKGKSLDDMMAYLDENGNLSSTPPNPKNKIPGQEDVKDSTSKHMKTDSKH
jgi:hypothetical protein